MIEGNLARDEIREETIHGIPVMSPRPVINHTLVSRRIVRIFEDHLQGKPCVPFPDNVDVHLTEEDTVVPDAFVVCDRSKIRWGAVYGAPDLAVEVLSPRTAKRDRTDKRELYERCGVREYWLADPAAKSIEQYLLRDGVLRLEEVYTWYADWELEEMDPREREEIPRSFRCGIFPDLEVRLDDIFRDLLQAPSYGG